MDLCANHNNITRLLVCANSGCSWNWYQVKLRSHLRHVLGKFTLSYEFKANTVKIWNACKYNGLIQCLFKA